MEFKFDIKDLSEKSILKIDYSLIPDGYEYDVNLQRRIAMIVDEMGKASARAQDLKMPITTAEKLAKSDHLIYLMTEQTNDDSNVVIGILKMGWKKLYLFDKKGTRSEAMVYCLLDFYVHETRQRQGYGVKIFEYMLKDNELEAKRLAIDRPSKKMLQFMVKHFKLKKPVDQGNNFVIFEEFFDTPGLTQLKDKCNSMNGYRSKITIGRHAANKHQDNMSDILHGANSATHVNDKYVVNADIVTSLQIIVFLWIIKINNITVKSKRTNRLYTDSTSLKLPYTIPY
ncbi:alpha-tubulin N-acetyltransferase 1-like isoform X2 [Daktulosphaira vitifoliae]|uniref:alpha-tubulin N-acetyltransferase 1-like isoform X2 n=1 Tax=Daktulosphaira vitifoliae TaxID=58002 RepID=UPI0021A9B220|nr:alpha-tubulin N-acetyltransferase 1-like isoform X2 [Daktulosphaira vitifoliae]